MLLFAALLLAQANPLGPASPTDIRDHRTGGNAAWIDGANDGLCRLPEATCAKQAWAHGRTAQAIAYLQAAARKGDAWAMRTIGLILLRGEGVGQDPETGVSWLYEAALHGDKPAMRALGTAFERGLGVEPDSHLARYWQARGRR